MLQRVQTHPSNDITINQTSVFSAANTSMNQSKTNNEGAESKLHESSVGEIHSLY